MRSIAELSPLKRDEIMVRLEKTADVNELRRLLAIWMLDRGVRQHEVTAYLCVSRQSVRRWGLRYQAGGIAALRSGQVGRPVRYAWRAIHYLLLALIEHTPQQLGYMRSRWSSELLARELYRLTGLVLASSTVRRRLKYLGIVYRRARPTLCKEDPQRAEKMQKIEDALASCSAAAPVLYVDEADVDLNPRIGFDWMRRGEQKAVATPGINRKRYLAGALHATTGRVLAVSGERKTTDLFLALLEHLKRRYRRAEKVRLIVDNYRIHSSRAVQKWLAETPKFELLFQPIYSPNVNRIERLWKLMHDTVTRNHCCTTLERLMENITHFLEQVSPFPGSQVSLENGRLMAHN